MKILKLLIVLCLWTSFCFADTSHVTATTASSSLVTADTQRTVLIIKNIGSTTCRLTDETTAAMDSFELLPGDVYIATERHAKPAINVITETRTTTLSVWERKE